MVLILDRLFILLYCFFCITEAARRSRPLLTVHLAVRKISFYMFIFLCFFFFMTSKCRILPSEISSSQWCYFNFSSLFCCCCFVFAQNKKRLLCVFYSSTKIASITFTKDFHSTRVRRNQTQTGKLSRDFFAPPLPK